MMLARGNGTGSRSTRRARLSPIKAMELAASRVSGVVSLAQGVPSFDTPDVIKAFVQQKIAAGECAKYSLTPGLPQLRESIAESLLREGMHYDPDREIIVSCGSIEAIAASLLALTRPGDEVILPSPSYASYREAVAVAGCTPRFAALREEHNFAFDAAAFESCLSPRTRAILYCNPNNPTGTVFSEAETRALLRLAERHGLYLLCDEAYKDFVYGTQPVSSPATLAETADLRRRVVRIFTFSKAYGMTGWRVGYLHSDARTVRDILTVHDALVTCAPVVSQYAALAALEYGDAHIATFRQAFKDRRDLMLTRLDRLSHVFDYQKPEGAYFVFPRVKDVIARARDSQALAADLLHKAKVAVVPGVAFGPSGEAHLRFNFGRESDEIEAAFERLTDYFQSAGAPRTQPVSQAVRHAPADFGYPNSPPVPPYGQTASRLRGAAVRLLRGLARIALWRARPRVIAIAGSHGKTIVKRIVSELFARRYRVQTNPRSYNTDVGLPLAVLNVELDSPRPRDVMRSFGQAMWRALIGRPAIDFLIVEFGVRKPGDMAQLLRTVRPDFAVLTKLTPGYSTDVAVLRTLQREMQVLCQAVQDRCRFVVDGDDPLLADAIAGLPQPPCVLRRSLWHEVVSGLELHGEQARYAVRREIIGDNERFAVHAAVILAERWIELPPGDVRDFLGAGPDEREAGPGLGKRASLPNEPTPVSTSSTG